MLRPLRVGAGRAQHRSHGLRRRRFPNGRRPGDDVVDIVLDVVEGYLLADSEASSAIAGFGTGGSGRLLSDGALVDDTFFSGTFPYLRDPLPGSP